MTDAAATPLTPLASTVKVVDAVGAAADLPSLQGSGGLGGVWIRYAAEEGTRRRCYAGAWCRRGGQAEEIERHAAGNQDDRQTNER